MNILDIDDAELHSACYRASDQLMWDGRQQTEPAEMHRYALAATCAEMYPDALIQFRRDKVLAAFDLSLTDSERGGILADVEANGGKLGMEASAKLSAFLNATAIRHVALDASSALDSMRAGFPQPNFGAVVEHCAEEVAGTDLGSAAKRAAELKMESKGNPAAGLLETVDSSPVDLDTPEGVKEALLSGRNLWNPGSSEFWYPYNNSGSIADASIHLDDPNLLAAVDSPDFDLYEDLVGRLNYESYITESPEWYAENDEEPPYPNPLVFDERDEIFARIAGEDGWIVATPENVREAVRAAGLATDAREAARQKTGIEFTFGPLGSPVQVELVRTAYMGGALAVSALLSDPADEEFGEPWGSITVNLSSPLQEGATVLLDTNNMSRELLAKVNELGAPTGQREASGFCTYPAFTFDEGVLGNMRTPDEFHAAPHETLIQDTGLDLDTEARDMRGVADGISTRQPEATGRAERGC